MVNLSKQERKNLEESIADLNKAIPKDKKELADAEKCLEYMALNYYDEQIEKIITKILKFYINDVKELIRQHRSEKDAYTSILKKRKRND